MSPSPRRIDLSAAATLDVLGAQVQLLTDPERRHEPLIIRGSVPAGGVVPLHTHADPETFVTFSGALDALVYSDDGPEWVEIRTNDVFHVPGGAKHGFRNRGREPAVTVIVTTPNLGLFFREVGTPVAPGSEPMGPPSQETIEHFLETAKRYGYWNATPEENAAVGLGLPVSD
jgi:quercetin dioxygenase-like cupin family protein